jgi:NAD(P)H-hydrate epimerase
MVRILSSTQIKELDAFTIANEPIASIDLMERASRAFTSWFTERFDVTQQVGIVCGTGNNGGDGLAIARLLSQWNYKVKVWIVRGLVPESEDFKINLTRLKDKVELFEIVTESDRGLFAGCTILIDAIFGSGLSRPVEGIYAQAIQCINQTDAIRIAVDIPSGLMADGPSQGAIVKANYTVSFQLPKLSFLMPSSYAYTGEWCLVDIGLNKEFLKKADTHHFFTTLKDIRKIVKVRSKFDHKGHYGHALLVTGSYGKIGASVLSAQAAMRSGLGLLTIHAPRCGYTVLQSTVPEAMMMADENDEVITQVQNAATFNAIGIGPGIGQTGQTVKAFSHLMEGFRKPMVIDADALNILASHRELLAIIPEGSILTPHPKEFERLVGTWTDDFDRLEKLKAFARKLKCVVVLKGANTSIASSDGKVYFNPTGNPGMATGGSGDVLTGILTGLLARSYNPQDAAVLGVYLHGLAGDLAAQNIGYESLIAGDLIRYVPAAFQQIGQSG